jgi:hypothetical protein
MTRMPQFLLPQRLLLAFNTECANTLQHYSPRHFRGLQQPEPSSLIEGYGLAQCCKVDVGATALYNVLHQLRANVLASASMTACHMGMWSEKK